MGFTDLFVKRRKIGKYTNFSLTPNGKERIDSGTDGSPGSRILVAIDSLRSGNTDEIAEEAKMSMGTVEKFLPILAKRGYVHVVRPEGE